MPFSSITLVSPIYHTPSGVLTDSPDPRNYWKVLKSRLIQSVPSPKAEPFKGWMAQIASERIDELQDPELTIDRAMWEYKRLGYSDNWINQCLKSIEIRKNLTDEWKHHHQNLV